MKETVLFNYSLNKYDDQEVWDLIGTDHSAGLFQISSPTYKKRMPKLKPQSIKELANCLALIRGPAISSGMDQLYIDIINGEKKPIMIHPFYDNATKGTHGVLIYQEQLMEIAVNFGLSLEEGYALMKAAAKKKFNVLEGYKEQFYSHPDVDKKSVEKIFELVVNAGQYLFNSSHAVCYALLTYASAWYKTYYKVDFYKNLLTNAYDRKNYDEAYEVHKELKTEKIKVLNPDINQSRWECTKEDNAIRIGFVALKNVGEDAAMHIQELQPIEDYSDFQERKTNKICNKRAAASLVFAGAFDSINKDRSEVIREFYQAHKTKKDPEFDSLKVYKITTKSIIDLSKGNKHYEKMVMSK